MAMGFSYQPGQTDMNMSPTGDMQGRSAMTPQEAVKILSLRVPRTASPGAISPLPLLTAAGGGGSDLDMLIAALAGLNQGSGGFGFTPDTRQGLDSGNVGQAGIRPPQMGRFTPGPPRITPGWDGPRAGAEIVPIGSGGGGMTLDPTTPIDTTGRTMGTGGYAGGITNGDGWGNGITRQVTPLF